MTTFHARPPSKSTEDSDPADPARDIDKTIPTLKKNNVLMKHKKESFTMEHEDVIKVSTEATIYLINNYNDESLHIAKLIPSISNPRQFEEAINSSSSVTQTLSGEVADGQHKLIALAAARGNSSAVNPLVTQLTNGPLGGLHLKSHLVFDFVKCFGSGSVKCVDADDSAKFGDTPQLADQVTELLPTQI
ncbi:hypothetical protein EV2_006404 [Malus domestica]